MKWTEIFSVLTDKPLDILHILKHYLGKTALDNIELHPSAFAVFEEGTYYIYINSKPLNSMWKVPFVRTLEDLQGREISVKHFYHEHIIQDNGTEARISRILSQKISTVFVVFY